MRSTASSQLPLASSITVSPGSSPRNCNHFHLFHESIHGLIRWANNTRFLPCCNLMKCPLSFGPRQIRSRLVLAWFLSLTFQIDAELPRYVSLLLSLHELQRGGRWLHLHVSPTRPWTSSEIISGVQWRGMSFICGYKVDVAGTQQHSSFYGPGQEWTCAVGWFGSWEWEGSLHGL